MLSERTHTAYARLVKFLVIRRVKTCIYEAYAIVGHQTGKTCKFGHQMGRICSCWASIGIGQIRKQAHFPGSLACDRTAFGAAKQLDNFKTEEGLKESSACKHASVSQSVSITVMLLLLINLNCS